MNYTYTTLLSTMDYLLGVLMLKESLDMVHAKYPLTVCVPKDIVNDVQEVLTRSGCNIYPIERLWYNETTKQWCDARHWPQTVQHTASKLEIFGLPYDKVVYLDADTFVIENIDDLFDYPDTSMVLYPKDDQGFSGLMVFVPKHHPKDMYITLMQNYLCLDGNLLGRLWIAVKDNPAYQIPPEYLVNFDAKTIDHAILGRKVKVVHFINHPKPWYGDGNPSQLWVFYQTVLRRVMKRYDLTFTQKYTLTD